MLHAIANPSIIGKWGGDKKKTKDIENDYTEAYAYNAYYASDDTYLSDPL